MSTTVFTLVWSMMVVLLHPWYARLITHHSNHRALDSIPSGRHTCAWACKPASMMYRSRLLRRSPSARAALSSCSSASFAAYSAAMSEACNTLQATHKKLCCCETHGAKPVWWLWLHAVGVAGGHFVPTTIMCPHYTTNEER